MSDINPRGSIGIINMTGLENVASKLSATPGPWWSSENCGIERLEAKANANLMAAAPQLLAACKAAAEFWKDTDAPTGQLLRDAIAAAERQP